jgi:hypothetical protein
MNDSINLLVLNDQLHIISQYQKSLTLIFYISDRLPVQNSYKTPETGGDFIY